MKTKNANIILPERSGRYSETYRRFASLRTKRSGVKQSKKPDVWIASLPLAMTSRNSGGYSDHSTAILSMNNLTIDPSTATLSTNNLTIDPSTATLSMNNLTVDPSTATLSMHNLTIYPSTTTLSMHNLTVDASPVMS